MTIIREIGYFILGFIAIAIALPFVLIINPVRQFWMGLKIGYRAARK